MAESRGTKQQLIEATMYAIDSGGEASVRVSSVASVVGVKEPSVYHFFKNREDLVEAAQIERYRRSYTEMVLPFEWAVQMSDTREEFEHLVVKLLTTVFSDERRAFRSIRMNVLGSAQTNEAIANAVIAINQETALVLEKVLVSAQERGWIQSQYSALELAYWIMGQVNGRVMVEMNQDQIAIEQWDKIAIDAILRIFWPTTAR